MKTVLQVMFLGCLLVLSGSRTARSQAQPKTQQRGPAMTAETSPAALSDLDAYAAEQDRMLEELRHATAQSFWDHSAYVLSELWRAGLLKDEIKEQLVSEHYRVVLLQSHGSGGVPSFVVRCYQTFPFPDIWTEFTPTLYRNDQVEWAPEQPQRAHAMSQNNSTITSRSGGVVKKGDVLQYRIEVSQAKRDLSDNRSVNTAQVRPWRMTLWTNKLLAQGLKELRPGG